MTTHGATHRLLDPQTVELGPTCDLDSLLLFWLSPSFCWLFPSLWPALAFGGVGTLGLHGACNQWLS